MSALDDLLQQIQAHHFPNPPASPDQILDRERTLGISLPFALKTFYAFCNGAWLFERPESPYFILPLEQWERTRKSISGIDDDKYGPPAWYSFCDVLDGNYLAIDVASIQGNTCRIIDCFHETFPDPGYSQIIALSFAEFLGDALASGGKPYYLDKNFKGYGRT